MEFTCAYAESDSLEIGELDYIGSTGVNYVPFTVRTNYDSYEFFLKVSDIDALCEHLQAQKKAAERVKVGDSVKHKHGRFVLSRKVEYILNTEDGQYCKLYEDIGILYAIEDLEKV